MLPREFGKTVSFYAAYIPNIAQISCLTTADILPSVSGYRNIYALHIYGGFLEVKE